jgi:hypothetical protein
MDFFAVKKVNMVQLHARLACSVNKILQNELYQNQGKRLKNLQNQRVCFT